ncbi:MAG: FtsW/RodA/SpoVE family cell cycle protein [Bacteroidetes bacterium]|nr:FtsW/RodA/SpoVE family cell cycle protein [Rhodothermia bacterium]MCS7155867.1 FtsW/RodA/SpoVE family cell cycle protein [Bacteroidota bacterium]MCX7906032.1 FtsW/RodA/SpoVE family cell cycle protein [Bacteroidota bacterium]MDW8138160.1 FtsW/RodA/SpoVE family cell cycle protein [Bacteroidota bacterium]MDW8285844.1 FtsW/RodA/SpoVE family cell cycle protein [Bacteroidota bacterium]
MSYRPTPDAPGGVDRIFLWTVLALLLLGTLAVFSSMASLATHRAEGGLGGLMLRRLTHVGMGIAALLILSRIDYHVVARWSRAVLLFSLGLVGLVWWFAEGPGASARWLRIAGASFQPSELARAALTVYLATLLARKQPCIADMDRALLPALCWIGLGVGLIGPSNLSAAVLLLVVSAVLLFLGRIPVRQLLVVGLVGIALSGILIGMAPYRWERLERFAARIGQGELDPLGDDYQVVQSLIALANGGLFGVGMGKSVQRDFLPLPYNDFVFAIIVEEYGLVGGAALVGLFVVLLVRGFFYVARWAPDALGFLLAGGLTTALLVQAFVHVLIVVGLGPVTGQTLPFVSYGGTALLVSCAQAGIVLNVSRQARRRQ